MGARSRELILLLAVCALALSEPVNKTAGAKKDKDSENDLYQYEDYDQEVLFSEDRPCPRDCICTVTQGYRIAKCNRLEVGTQKFGDDISDVVVENADPRFPIELNDFIFKKLGLHNVATIKIVNSTISTIGPKAFHDLPDLYAVNIAHNKLKNIHPETFALNKKLLLLTLSNNPLEIPDNDYFLNASSVQELDISYCGVQSVHAHTFKNMLSVMYLNLAGNNLSKMDDDTFKQLLDLEELDLSDNNIDSLPDNIFSENAELATLHIQKNPISTVLDLQVGDLLTLNAGQTNIKLIGPSMFNGMKYIANLNLSGNHIDKIHNLAFEKLVELNFLDLSYNNLDFVSNILIKDNIELDIFKISNNPRLKHLPVDGFNSSAEMFNIYLFDASNCALEEIYDDSLKTFTALSQINLSGNKIKAISPKVFSRATKLVEINLAYNLITTLDVKVFEKNSELAKLFLQGNPLKTFSARVFSFTPVLSYLDMSHAELTAPWKSDKNQSMVLSNLSFLNVSHNRISEIQQSKLDPLQKLRVLDISNNPLACNREFENLMTWLSTRKISPNTNSNTASIANLAKDKKVETETYSWEFLSRKTCGEPLPVPVVHKVEPLPSVSEDDIWETINKGDESNFDLKETLDDGKIPDDTKVSTSNKLTNDVDDDDDGKDGEYEDDDDSASDDDDDEYDDDMDLKFSEKSTTAKTKLAEKTIEKESKQKADSPVEDVVKIKIRLMEKDMEPQVSYVAEAADEEEHGNYEYLWPILIAIAGAVVLLVVVAKTVALVCTRRQRQVRYNSAIIAAMQQQGRTKKDCGLVYQQLSEELGPATPKLSRYAPLRSVTVNAANLSYESSPFHHSNIVPEAV